MCKFFPTSQIYDIYGPVLMPLMQANTYLGKWDRVGPWKSRLFRAPNGTRRTARCHFTGPKKVPISAIILALRFFQHLHIIFWCLLYSFVPFHYGTVFSLKKSLGKSNCTYVLLYILIVATVYMQFLLQSSMSIFQCCSAE